MKHTETWYTTTKEDALQGLICDENTGENIAVSYDPKHAHLIAAAPELLKACEEARNLYDHLALGTLEAAAKYGPDYEPPTDEDCLEVRDLLETVINKAEGR